MAGLFGGKQKTPEMPPVPPPAPIPRVDTAAEDQQMLRVKRRKGFANTILTGALSPDTGKKTLLG